MPAALQKLSFGKLPTANHKLTWTGRALNMGENTMIVRGGCLCRAVGYEVRLPFAKFVNCYCSRCRKASGSMHMTSANVSPEAFKWTSGEILVVRYDLPEARSFATSFCSKCGSPVPHATRSGREIIIPAGSLNDDPGAKPMASVQWNSRAPWAPRSTDLPIEE
jgi:hypothetical protein